MCYARMLLTCCLSEMQGLSSEGADPFITDDLLDDMVNRFSCVHVSSESTYMIKIQHRKQNLLYS